MSVNQRQPDGTLKKIAGLGQYDVPIDSSLSPTSTNPVQNKAITTELEKKATQYATLPTASSANEGAIVQYIGTDSTSYSIGGFYQCQEDSGAYSWVLLSQQITVDSALSPTSENPVQNKVINTALADKVDTSDLGTAAYKDVPESGDASTTEVVMGNDSRLTDSRNAKDVSAWAKASTKPTYTASEVGAIATTAKGSASGVAELDSTGKVPISQLPATMSRLEKYANRAAFPATGDDNTLYVALDTNYTYRWTGTDYVQIDESIQLGETASTAYRGDRGKVAYDHSQTTSGNPHNVTKSDVGLGNVGNFKAVSTVANQGLSDTEKGNARTNIGAGTSSLALGETSSTAYRGDRGKTAYDHSQTTSGNPHNVTKSDVGLGNVGNFKAVSTVASQGLTDTEKSNARTNIGVGNATLTIQKNGTTVKTFTSNATSDVTCNITMAKSDVGLGNVGNFKAVSTVASQGLSSTEQANARANIAAAAASSVANMQEQYYQTAEPSPSKVGAVWIG